jgi:hypothetical protein
MDENACVVGVSPTDLRQYDLSELSDAVLGFEYSTRDG